MKELCRYDFVVQASEALHKYIKTCATETNTKQLIADAHGAIHELEKIETELNSTIPAKVAQKKLSTALAEFQEKAKDLEPVTDKVGKFLTDNKAIFEKTKDIAEAILIIETTYSDLKYIHAHVGKRMVCANRIAA